MTLPYTVELNDIAMMIVQHHESDYLLRRAIDSSTGCTPRQHRAKIMAIAVHPYISGQPHRIKYLEAIYDYAASSTACCTGTASRFMTGTPRREIRRKPHRAGSGVSHPRPESKFVVHPSGEQIDLARNGEQIARREVGPGGPIARCQIVVFGLDGPCARQSVFDAAAGQPAGRGVTRADGSADPSQFCSGMRLP